MKETILQEKQRIAGHIKTIRSKEAASTDDRKLNGRDETILQEKQRIAGCSKNIRLTKAVSTDDCKLRDRQGRDHLARETTYRRAQQEYQVKGSCVH